MTTMLFHFGGVGIFLALVVVYQEDIRNGIERLTSIDWFRRQRIDEPLSQVIEEIIHATTEMAEK